jgi:hypothetical protein
MTDVFDACRDGRHHYDAADKPCVICGGTIVSQLSQYEIGGAVEVAVPPPDRACKPESCWRCKRDLKNASWTTFTGRTLPTCITCSDLPEVRAEIERRPIVWPEVKGDLASLAAADQPQLDGVRPRYYRQGKIEVWDFIEDQNLGFLAGNVVKYVCRFALKGGVIDLEKAQTYLTKLIAVTKERR